MRPWWISLASCESYLNSFPPIFFSDSNREYIRTAVNFSSTFSMLVIANFTSFASKYSFLESGFDMKVIVPHCRTESSTIGWTQFYSKEKVIQGGMWNENFLSWGAEDCEFYFRFNALGYRVARIADWIWHFEHSRSHNSHYHHHHHHHQDRKSVV